MYVAKSKIQCICWLRIMAKYNTLVHNAFGTFRFIDAPAMHSIHLPLELSRIVKKNRQRTQHINY